MGFFKNIGKSIKKASKQISFKNFVKIAGKFDPTGIVGGIQDAHYAKKEAREAQKQNDLINQQNLEALALQKQQEVGNKFGNYANTIAGNLVEATVNGAYYGIDKGYKQGVANAGSDLATMTANTWFEKNQTKVLLGLVSIVGLILILKKK